MKNYLFLSLLASALLLTACEIIFLPPDYTPGEPATRQFWANDVRSKTYYRLSAQKLAEGEHCTVWVETGNPVNAAVAQSVARSYDRDVYPKMKNTFSIDNISYEGNKIDTLALADALTDDDGKLCILLLDIRDGYNPTTSPGYVGGYFDSTNLYSNASLPQNQRYSNECDMIFLDTYPAEPGSQDSYSTLAHETQHLINFVNTVVLERESLQDTWIDEGLSSAAEWVYLGDHLGQRVDWYNAATTAHKSKINSGNNFFVWDQYADDSALDDYATVYLFFQWLRLQSGGSTGIYKAISMSAYSDYNAIVTSINGYSNWGTLLKTWLAANYINAPSGPYGYMNDPTLKSVKARTAPAGPKSVNLYPGEGVYSVTDKSDSTPNQGKNIRYAGLNKSSGAVNDTAVYASGALLTYNIDTNAKGSREAGTTTGIAANVVNKVDESVPESLSVKPLLSGPYRIGAGEAFRRNGYEEKTPPPLRVNLGDSDN